MIDFPVFVSTRDSGDMKKYQNSREMEHALERIDVENGEYLAWDRQCRTMKLQVKEGPGWLALSTGEPAIPEFRGALARFTSSMGHESDSMVTDGTSAEAMYEAAAKHVSQAKGRMGWFKRLTRRF
jgi:hypothetical protein